MKWITILVSLLFLNDSQLFAQAPEKKESTKAGANESDTNTDPNEEVKKFDSLDFSNLKQVIKEDKLEKPYRKKIKKVKKIKQARKRVAAKKLDYFPKELEFWGIMSELWLVKNASLLKWDFEKPEYGIGESFRKVLKKLGYLEKKIKILVLNSSVITHFALPSKRNEYILLLGLPFIRSMDLTKREISMLLLEDLMRVDKKLFLKQLSLVEMEQYFAKKLQKNKRLVKKFSLVLKQYSEVVFKKGFTFQEQFTVTKAMNNMIKDTPELWNAYFKLNKKRQNLMRSNQTFKSYSKIYPSPEMQVNWLNPNSKIR
jgi:hypothetical protein